MSAFVDALRAADKAATGAPWEHHGDDMRGTSIVADGGGAWAARVTICRNTAASAMGAANARLIVLLRNAAPEIAALVEAGDALRHYDDPTVLLKASELAPLRAALSALDGKARGASVPDESAGRGEVTP